MTVRKQGNTALLFDAEMVELDEMGEVDSLQPLSWGTVFETACAARIQIYWDNWHEWWIMLAASRLVLPWTRGSEWNPFLFPWPGHMRRRTLVLSCVSKRREREARNEAQTLSKQLTTYIICSIDSSIDKIIWSHLWLVRKHHLRRDTSRSLKSPNCNEIGARRDHKIENQAASPVPQCWRTLVGRLRSAASARGLASHRHRSRHDQRRA